MHRQHYGFWRLLSRSLLPSTASLTVGLVAGLVIVGSHLFMLNAHQTDFFAQLSDNSVVAWYQHTFIDPLSRFLGNNALNYILLATFWGLLGVVCFNAGEFLLKNLGQWHEDRRAVRMVGEGQLVHPKLASFGRRFVWRLVIGTLLIYAVTGLWPLFAKLFARDVRVFQTHFALPNSLVMCALNILAWALVFHCFTVLVRLYVFRTRIFGELLY